MPKDLESAAPAYANPLQKTGYWDDNSKVTMFDPITGEYITRDVDPNNIMEFNPRGDQSMWGNANGEHQLIYTGGEGARDTGAMVNDGPGMDGMTWEWGATPQTYPEHTGPLSLGGPPTGNQPPPTQPPVTQPPAAQPPVAQPSAPTDDWYPTDPVGYQGAPQPTGDGSFDPGGPPPDTSWDWSYFRDKAPGDRQWGGYDEDYQAFERYQPGMDSPWGMPNVEGGNKDFYQQQFVNLLRDEQGFQNRERAAQARRQEADANPYENLMDDAGTWDWAYGGKGLPEVKMGGAAPTTNWELNSAFDPGVSTQADILRWASSGEGFDKGARDFYSKHLNNPENTNTDSTYWSTRNGPSDLIGGLPTDPSVLTRKNQAYMTDLFNSIYSRGSQGPHAPSNYASPVQWGNDYNALAATTTTD